jgi:hypothetical protein
MSYRKALRVRVLHQGVFYHFFWCLAFLVLVFSM